MEPSDYARRQKRGACLSLLMAAGGVLFFALLLVVATGGWAVYVIGVAGAIFLFGAMHYLLWGRAMMQNTAGDREEEELRQRIEEENEEPPGPGSNGITRRGAGL